MYVTPCTVGHTVHNKHPLKCVKNFLFFFVKMNYFKRIFRPSLFYFIFDQENNFLFDEFSFWRIFFSINFTFADFFFVSKNFLYHEFSCSLTFVLTNFVLLSITLQKWVRPSLSGRQCVMNLGLFLHRFANL